MVYSHVSHTFVHIATANFYCSDMFLLIAGEMISIFLSLCLLAPCSPFSPLPVPVSPHSLFPSSPRSLFPSLPTPCSPFSPLPVPVSPRSLFPYLPTPCSPISPLLVPLSPHSLFPFLPAPCSRLSPLPVPLSPHSLFPSLPTPCSPLSPLLVPLSPHSLFPLLSPLPLPLPTPHAAPEVLNSHNSTGYSYAVDWWGLGVSVYEMLRGQVRTLVTLFSCHFASSYAILLLFRPLRFFCHATCFFCHANLLTKLFFTTFATCFAEKCVCYKCLRQRKKHKDTFALSDFVLHSCAFIAIITVNVCVGVTHTKLHLQMLSLFEEPAASI